MIHDSGERRKFETGAVRDIAEGKGRCDLLPLDVIAERYRLPVLGALHQYMSHGKINCLWYALENMSEDPYGWSDMCNLLLDVSIHFEAGCEKYGDRNWEKGIPLHCYIDSAVRHYLKHQAGKTDERHDRAFVWNIICAIWTHKNKPEMIDLPFKGGSDENV